MITNFYPLDVVHQDPSIQMSRKAIRDSGRRRLISDQCQEEWFQDTGKAA